MQILNFNRSRIAEDKIKFKLDRLIEMMHHQPAPVALEDLIKRDLESNYQEDPENLIPLTDEELEEILYNVHHQS